MAESANFSKAVRRMFGVSLHLWENLMVGSLAVAAMAAAIVGVATYAVVQLQRQEIAESKDEFEKYKQDSNERISTTDARAAEANKIAEGEKLARIKLEKEMAWRSFSDEQKAALLLVARKYKGQQFDVMTYQDDPECLGFANQMARAFIDAGWTLETPKAFLFFPVVVGVQILIAPSHEAELAPAVNDVVFALEKTGIGAAAGLEKAFDTDGPRNHQNQNR